MKLLFPCNPINKREADSHFQEQYELLQDISDLVDYDTGKLLRQSDEQYLYRGWMMSNHQYATLDQQVNLAVNPTMYMTAHLLPGWYSRVKDLTPETVVCSRFSAPYEFQRLGWDSCFVKDWVKSNTGPLGSFAFTASEVWAIIREMNDYHGIKGGICLRKVENLIASTEKRYFVYKGEVFAPDFAFVPQSVYDVRDRFKDLLFYSVDVCKNAAGEYRLVEIGDGQVSDLKTWNVNRFCESLRVMVSLM